MESSYENETGVIMNQPITSFDAAKPGQFGDILNIERNQDNAVKVGLLAAGYFEYWRMYPALREIVDTDMSKVRDRLAAKVEVVYPGMVDNMDRAEEAGRVFARAGVKIVVVVEGTYLPDFMVLHVLEHVPNAHVILFNTQTGFDINPTDNYQATMRNSALIGTTQLSGSFNKAKRPYDVVVGEIADDRGYNEIAGIVRARVSADRLRKRNIGLVGHVFRGMFDLEFDRGGGRGILGPEVISIQVDHLIDLWKEIPGEQVKSKSQELAARFVVRHIKPEDIGRSVRLGLAMEKLTERYKLDALCFLGQHYIEKMTGAPARIGASLMMEKGFMVACEGDIGGLVMMELMHDLAGAIPVQMEWGQYDRKNNALFLLGHGIGSPTLAADPKKVALTRAPEEWGFEGNGVNWEMIAKPGPVTLGHFLNTADGWRMLISEGKSIDFPCLPCNEIHAMVQVKSPVEEYLKSLISLGVTHHIILVHGQIRRELERVADLMKVKHIFLE
jgi:L-arabinose isomerase